MLKKFFFFIMLACLFYHCKEDLSNSAKENPKVIYDTHATHPLVVFIIDENDNASINFNLQIQKTVNYTKIPYSTISVTALNTSFDIPKSTKVLIIRNAEVLSEAAIKSISNFVATGNTLVITNAPSGNKAGFLYGTKKFAKLSSNTNAGGIFFNMLMLPSFDKKGYQDEAPHFGLAAENFKKNIEVLASAFNDRSYPLIIKNTILNGRVIFFNSTNYAQKYNRGILFSSILSGLEGIPYPIANVSTIHLDDFPAPLYHIQKEPVFSEMNLYQDDFYRTIWWPDMLLLAKKYNLKYTAFPAFDYSGQIEPPFLFNEWNLNMKKGDDQLSQSDILMKEVYQNNHELGFHGYNHTSLLTQEWQNPKIMELSLNTVFKKWKTYNYGPLPKSYVPPSNMIDSVGLATLHKAFPSITTMSSLYLGNFAVGENREFDIEPLNQNIFDFPRISSGYDIAPRVRFADYSTLLYTGISNHFLHPDDVFQVEANEAFNSKGNYKYRNNKNLGWRNTANGAQGMLSYFESYITEKTTTFPLLQSYKTQDAIPLVKDWRNQKVTFTLTDSLVNVKSNSLRKGSFYWFVYVQEKNVWATEKSLTKQAISYTKSKYLDGYIFHLKTVNPEVLIFKEEGLMEPEKKDLKKEVDVKVQDYEAEKRTFNSTSEAVDFYIANGSLSEAIKLQQQRITTNTYFKETDWLKLNQLLAWNKQSEKTWNFLETQFMGAKKNAAIQFSKKLSEINYPEPEIRKIWLKRQIETTPNNANLKEEYNRYFAQESFSTLSAEELIALSDNATSKAEKIKYYELLIANYPESAILVFTNKTPCATEISKDLASKISWLFANNERYKEALYWSKCTSDISAETLKYWRIKTGDIEFLKANYYEEYLVNLLQKDPKKALEELENIAPCSTIKLSNVQSDIAYAYGNSGRLRKALAWANCADGFLRSDKMLYHLQLENYEAVEALYLEGEVKNSSTATEKLVLIESYLQTSNVNAAFKYAAQLKPSSEQEKIKKRLNEIVFYEPLKNQQFILANYGKVLYPETIIKLKKTIRISKGTSLEFNTDLLTDKFNPTSFGNLVTYSFRDRKERKHSFGITEYTAFALNLPEINTNNTTQNLYGLYYGFRPKERFEKLNYNTAITVEFNENSKVFYQLNLGANISKKNLYSAFLLSHQPAITSPAYHLNIYRTQLTVYEELNFKKRYQAILTLQANNFSDNEQDVLLMTRFGAKLNQAKKNNYMPYAEAAGMLGTTNNSVGFPYWTIDQRFYGGLGMNYRYKNNASLFEFGLNGGAFLDTFSGSFLRYGGNINYPITDYFSITGNAEFFTIKNFYSNNFRLGLKYYLK